MFSSILFLLAQAPAGASEPPVEPPAVVAQRAAAAALEAQGMFTDAGHTYVELADMPGVNRRNELDKAHTNYDSAYGATKDPSRLCWALSIAEQVVREGEFIDAEQERFWRDTVDDDLGRLQADAQKNRRANCRFDHSGAPRVLVATLNDEDFTEQAPSSDREDIHQDDRRPRPKEATTKRWRAQTASGAVFIGLGLGLVGAFAGVLESQVQHARTMRRMTSMAKGEGRDFTDGEWQEFNEIRDEGRQLRAVAIGVGVAGVVTLSTGVALLATRTRVSRKFAVQPYGGPLGGGMVFRLRF